MNIGGVRVDGDDFGTLASSLLAMPRFPGFRQRPVFLHAQGRPDQARFDSVDLGGGPI
jgi:hypothetical protein